MAEDDIYQNKRIYELFITNLNKLLVKGVKKYYCKNKANLKYFKSLINKFEVDDLSYIRRLRLLSELKFLTYVINCDLKDIDDKTRDNLIIEVRKKTKPSNLKKTKGDIKRIFNVLFDEDIPKSMKKFEIKVDISRQKARTDKLVYDEFDKIMKFFSNNTVMQAYLSLAFESLGRPQEICYTKISDLELFDNYAIVSINEHGKEGIKKLLSIDSFPYLIKMYNQHKNRKNQNSFLFLNEYGNQLKPLAINKKIKIACKRLDIDKPITCYSLKRFGVTFRRLNGNSDVEIQRIAGWTSPKQLKTYDLSNQDDVFKIELAKRGLIKDNGLSKYAPVSKNCEYCGDRVGFAESTCPKCFHIVDKDLIKKRAEINRLKDIPNKILNEIIDDELINLMIKKMEEKGVKI